MVVAQCHSASDLTCPKCGRPPMLVRTLYVDPIDDIVEVRCAKHGFHIIRILRGGGG